jgi:uncharacterized protein
MSTDPTSNRPTGMAAESVSTWVRLAVLIAAVFPFILTLTYFHLLANAGRLAQFLVYTPGKVLQFAFPIAFMVIASGWAFRQWARSLRAPSGAELLVGLFSGLLAAGLGWIVYVNVLLPTGAMDLARANIIIKMAEGGLDNPTAFVLVAVGYSCFHAGLEEYYWRWFVYGQARSLFGTRPALVFAAVAFTAHHVIVVGSFFGLANPWTWVLSGAIGVGGSFWCWMYQRYGLIWGAWLSHALIDAGIFVIGYDLIFLS